MYVEADDVRVIATQMSETSISDYVLESLIVRASRMFDLVCGVEPGYFEARAAGDASPLVIYGDGTNFLKLPPYVSGTLSTTITLPDGYTVPTFVQKNGYLILTTNGTLGVADWSAGGGWYTGVAVTVTAKWGFEATPEDVKQMIIEWVINLWRETDPAFLKLVNIEGQPLRETMPPRVNLVAKRYRFKNAVFV